MALSGSILGDTIDHSSFLTPQNNLQNKISCRKCTARKQKKLTSRKNVFLTTDADVKGHIPGNRRKSREGSRDQESRTLVG